MDTGGMVGKYELTRFPPSLLKSAHIMHIPNKPDFESIYDDFIGNQPQPNLQNSIYIWWWSFYSYDPIIGQEDSSRQSAK